MSDDHESISSYGDHRGLYVGIHGVVSVLAMQGVPLLLAFLGVYLFAVWVMVVMQKRARELFEGKDHFAQRSYDRDSTARRVRFNDLDENEEDALNQSQLHA